MDNLNYQTLEKKRYNGYLLQEAPERVLQFGEGNFLRAFVDYFVDVANEKGDFNSKVVITQPIGGGLADMINDQQGLYTLYLRGSKNGEAVEEKRVISCVSRCLNPYKDYADLLEVAHNPELRFIISNTTEAGIVYDDSCKFDDAPPASFPAKLTRFLYERFSAFGNESGKGLVILPCELIDDNGVELEKCVRQHISDWNLSEDFCKWLDSEVLFCPTLVDRIVPGYPRNEAEKLWEQNGYSDNLIDTGELFGLWVIEGPDSLKEELPFEKSGLPVIVTGDHKPYKERKVRILNGAHTTMFSVGYLSGMDIVRECMDDENLYSFTRKTIFDEIIPTLSLPQDELEQFAEDVLDRFKNPYIDHQLLSISLNSVSKWRARVLPTVRGYMGKFEKVPVRLVLGFAALLEFYHGDKVLDGKLIAKRNGDDYEVLDDAWVLEFFAAHYGDSIEEYVVNVCANEKFWGMNLNDIPQFTDTVVEYVTDIRKNGMADTVKSC